MNKNLTQAYRARVVSCGKPSLCCMDGNTFEKAGFEPVAMIKWWPRQGESTIQVPYQGAENASAKSRSSKTV